MVTLVDFSKGDWSGVAFDIALVALNYFLYKKWPHLKNIYLCGLQLLY